MAHLRRGDGPLSSGTSDVTFQVGAGRLRVMHADITTVACDVVVNAANARMMGGGGVDGAIHRAAGPSVMLELREAMRGLGAVAPAEHVVTHAGQLPARWVIHAVGPIWQGGERGEDEALRQTVLRALEKARELGASSVAFPAISTGAYGFPRERAAPIFFAEFGAALALEGDLREIKMVLFSRSDFELWAEGARQTFALAK